MSGARWPLTTLALAAGGVVLVALGYKAGQAKGIPVVGGGAAGTKPPPAPGALDAATILDDSAEVAKLGVILLA